MEITISLTDSIYKKLVEKEGKWEVDIDCSITVGVKTMRIASIREQAKKRNQRERAKKYTVRDKDRPYLEDCYRLIKAYGRKFLGKREFTLPYNSPHFPKFLETIKQINRLSTTTKIAKGDLRRYLLKTIAQRYDTSDRAITPGFLCSELTWNILFPQYLRDIIPGLTLEKGGKNEESA